MQTAEGGEEGADFVGFMVHHVARKEDEVGPQGIDAVHHAFQKLGVRGECAHM